MTVPLFVLFTALLALTSAGKPSACPYSRRLHALRDNVIPPGTQYNFVDPNFSRIQAFGCGRLYGASWGPYIRTTANNYLVQQFGIDWLQGVHDGAGTYTRTEGIFYPYIYGTDLMYRVLSDVVDCKETIKNKDYKFLINTGYLVQHTTSGVYPAGAMAGTAYRAGEIISYTEYNILDANLQNKWGTNNTDARQRIIIRSRQPGHTTPNSLGGFDIQVYEELVDQATGALGFSSFTVTNTNSSRWNGDKRVLQSTRNTMTWPHAQIYPNPMPSVEGPPAHH